MQTDPRDGPSRSPNGALPAAQLRDLQVVCRKLEHENRTLHATIARVQRGASALASENAGLRVEIARIREHPRAADAAPTEIALAPDVEAPGDARAAVVRRLAATVAPSVLECAELVASELVTNSIRHSGVTSDDRVKLHIETTPTVVRLEVEDPGRGAAIAVRPIVAGSEDGFGLNIVEILSERWGVEHAARGTRVWAELALLPS